MLSENVKEENHRKPSSVSSIVATDEKCQLSSVLNQRTAFFWKLLLAQLPLVQQKKDKGS